MPRRAFYDIWPTNLKDFSAFFEYFITSLDTSQLTVTQCVLLISELAFPVLPSQPASNLPCSVADSDLAVASTSTSASTSQFPFQVILLGVNEITKSECGFELIKLICKIGDERLQQRIIVLPIVTSLSQTMVLNALFEAGRDANRDANLVPLPVHLPGAANVVMAKLQLEPRHRQAIESICNSLCSHGRMLEALCDTLDPASTDPRSRALRESLLRDDASATGAIVRAAAARGGMGFF